MIFYLLLLILQDLMSQWFLTGSPLMSDNFILLHDCLSQFLGHFLLISYHLNTGLLLKLHLFVQLCLFLPFWFLKLMLNSLWLNSWPFHGLLFMSIVDVKLLLSLIVQLILKGSILSKLKRVYIFAKGF